RMLQFAPWLRYPPLGEESVGVVQLLLKARVGAAFRKVEVTQQRLQRNGGVQVGVTCVHRSVSSTSHQPNRAMALYASITEFRGCGHSARRRAGESSGLRSRRLFIPPGWVRSPE